MAEAIDEAMETENSRVEGATEAQVTTNTSRGTRLIITKIVNENFKSYAGVVELGPFHKRFSSIVGPNGSGKSNVIDAMLFVFGYRSKMIRTKKVSQLIHNSSTCPDCTYCTVSVHFQKIYDKDSDDEDQIEVVPNSEFIVSRTARKDNSSEYHVNGRKTPFKEVAALLRSCGIDLDHNRFLILQGEVEQIAMMKPKAVTEHEDGMLEYLEDIIGSSKYKEPIEDLAKEVEGLNEVRGEKLNRVKAVEKEKDELQGSKDEAVEYINMENNITKHKNVLYQKYVQECLKNEEKALEKSNEVKAGFEDIHKQMKEITSEKKAKEKEHNKTKRQYDELLQVAEQTKKNFSDFEKEDVKLREDLAYSQENVKKLKTSLGKEKGKGEKLQKDVEANEKRVTELTTKKEQLEAQKVKEEEKLAEVMESLKTETQGLQDEKEGKETDLMEKKKVANDAKSKVDVAKSELEVYRSQHDNAMSQLREARNNLEATIQKSQQRNSEIKSLEKELPAAKKSFADTEKELEKAIELEEKNTGEMRSLIVKVEQAKSSLQASRNSGEILKALMKQKELGNIKGIYGRLGDLGAIDDKYDVAISTACAPLDHIVCDTYETAQECVKYIKANNLGVQTFIGLDKMEKHREAATSKIKTPENVPRLYDLVRVKDPEKHSTAFYHALRDTIVADNLQQANRVAYQGNRWRVVTLQGILFERIGTMSGGGNRVSKGRMCSSFVSDVSPKQLVDMEKKLEHSKQESEKHRESKEKLEENLEELRKKITTMEHQLQKNKMEVAGLKEQEQTLNEQIIRLKKEVEKTTPDKEKLKELETTVEKFQKEWNKTNTAASKIENEVQALNKKIMDIGGAKMSGQQARLDTAVKAIDEIQGQITKANVAVKTAQRNIKKAEDKVVSLETEIEETNEKIKNMKEELQTLEEKAIKVQDAHASAEEQLKEMEQVLKKSVEEYAAVEAKEQALRTKEVDIKHEVEQFEGILKENQQKVKHWKKELSKLSLQSIGLSDQQEESTLPTLTPEELESIDKDTASYEITVEEERLRQMKPNMAAIAEYRKKEEAYLSRVRELDQVTSDRDKKRREHEALRKKRLDEFMAGFTMITTTLKEMYQMITLGGDAELELVDSLDPFSEGIVFSVRPYKKTWKNISNLSGGEKTLSSLALVFALHIYKPTPLYVMDEIDAALDFRNVSIVANYIKERTKNAQFIIISLRNNMFELANHLVGIYKTHDCTKSVTINPGHIAKQG